MPRLRGEAGAVMIIAAFAIGFALIPLLGLYVVDFSTLVTHKRQLQLQADAAALAAGDRFGECFTSPANAYADMSSEAARYSSPDLAQQTGSGGALTSVAIPSPSFNQTSPGQFGASDKGSITALFNSKDYATQPRPPATDNSAVFGDPCAPASDMFDVKMTEVDSPLFFPFPGLHYGINAHARVSLETTGTGKGSQPMAVPDVNPTNVFVSVWNMTTGDTIGTYRLDTKMLVNPTTNPLNAWSNSSPISLSIPSGNSTLGVRVGIGNSFGNCVPPSNGGPGKGYECYDQDGATPLMVIHGYDQNAVELYNSPKLRSLNEISCSGSPFFSDQDTSTTCTTTVTAHVDWGTCAPLYTCTDTITATDVRPSNNNNRTQTSPNCTTGCSKDYSFSFTDYPLDNGQEPVSISWTYSMTGPACGGRNQPACPTGFPSGQGIFNPATPTFGNGGNAKPLHQAAYSADPDLAASGPIERASIDGCGLATPCYSFAGGTSPSLTFHVYLVPNLGSLYFDPATGRRPAGTTDIIRVGSKDTNRTTAVDCDNGGANAIALAIQKGCQTPYQLNTSGICPDLQPPGPPTPDCMRIQPGSLAQKILQAIQSKYNAPTCAGFLNHYNDAGGFSSSDPRILQFYVTDQGLLLNDSGTGWAPVTNYATFYITGWAIRNGGGWNTDCPATNEPVPPTILNGNTKNGVVAIWGHFIEYANPQNTGPGPQCPPTPGPYPCAPVLTR